MVVFSLKILFMAINNNLEILELVSRELRKHMDISQISILNMGSYIPSSFVTMADIELRFGNMSCENLDDYSAPNSVTLLRSLNPDIIIMSNDTGISCLAFLEAAKFLKIPSLFIQPAIIIQSPTSRIKMIRGLFWLASISNMRLTCKMYGLLWRSERSIHGNLAGSFIILKNIFNHFFHFFNDGRGGCTKIAVIGNYTKDLFIHRGIPSQSICVTGLPKLDVILNREFDRTEFLKKVGLTDGKKIISLLTDAAVEHRLWTRNQRKDFIYRIIKSLKDVHEIQLIIKVHPVEDPTDYVLINEELGGSAKVLKDINLYDVIEISDVVITGISTAGLESLLFEKPLITPNFYNDPEYIPYIRDGVAIGVYDSKDLMSAVRAALNDRETRGIMATNRERFIYYFAYLQDGKASARVAELILNMVKKYDH